MTSARGLGWRPDRCKEGGREGGEVKGWKPTRSGIRGMVGDPGGARVAGGRGVEEVRREVTWGEREAKEVSWEAGEADREV